MNIKFHLTGQTDLLMHQDSIEKAEIATAWQTDPANKQLSKKGDDRSPAWLWQGYLYEDGEHVVVPYENIMTCIRSAATQIQLKGNKTFKESSQSSLIRTDEYCEFRCRGEKISMLDIAAMRDLSFVDQQAACERLGFRLWMKRAVVKGNRHIRVRPRFPVWSVTGSLINTRPDILTRQIVEQIFTIAGQVGIGDWRPGCPKPGPYGMFSSKLSFS